MRRSSLRGFIPKSHVRTFMFVRTVMVLEIPAFSYRILYVRGVRGDLGDYNYFIVTFAVNVFLSIAV